MKGRTSWLARVRNRLMPGRKARRRAEKARAREEGFRSGLWTQGETLAARTYGSYGEYLAHQASKLDADYERRAAKDTEETAEFVRRFGLCEPLRGAHAVLCLGARLGAEVRALRQLGHFAVGIDLNPGQGNAYVHYGDFHALTFANASADAVYTNTLDHVFDLERVVREVVRVLRPGGLLIADVLPGFDEGFLPGKYEAAHWRRMDDLVDRIVEAGKFERVGTRDLGTRGRNPWTQIVLRKPGG